MVANDNAYLLAKRGALESIASKLAPTISLTEQHYPEEGVFHLWITYSTLTDFARLRGWSTSVPLSTAT